VSVPFPVGLGLHTRTIGESDASIDDRHATAAQFGTIFVAIELSQKSWLVTLHSPDKASYPAISWRVAIMSNCWR
jgi:hypothetical protein